ncbi:hypothetical protein D9M72_387320 [compost metagenome]
MGLHPVGVGLHQQRAGAFARQLHRAAQHGKERDDVVAVHAFAGHAVAHGFVCQRRCYGLVGQRHRDGVLVVLDEEDDREVEDGREVERFMEVAFAGGAVAAHGQDYGVLAAEFGGVRNADGVEQLGGERGALDADLVLEGVVAAVPVAAEEGHGLHWVHAAGHHGHGVAVGGEDPVAIREAKCGRHLTRFLSVAGRIDGHAALADQSRVLVVDAAADDQLLIGSQQFGVAGKRVFVSGLGALLGVGVQGPVLIHHLDLVAGRQHVVLHRDAELAHSLGYGVFSHMVPGRLFRRVLPEGGVVRGDRHWSVLL